METLGKNQKSSSTQSEYLLLLSECDGSVHVQLNLKIPADSLFENAVAVEEEKKRRLEVEQQLIVIQADKKAAMAAAAQVAGGNEAKAAELAKELSVVKAELEALGKNQQKSTGQGLIFLHLTILHTLVLIQISVSLTICSRLRVSQSRRRRREDLRSRSS